MCVYITAHCIEILLLLLLLYVSPGTKYVHPKGSAEKESSFGYSTINRGGVETTAAHLIVPKNMACVRQVTA